MLHRLFRRIAPLALAAAALAACTPDAPLAPLSDAPARVATFTPTASRAQISRERATVPFSFVVYASCANGGEGEVLQANGELEYSGRWFMSNDGQRHHGALVERFTGSAVGWDTGEAYDVTSREHSQDNISEGGDGIPDSGEQLERIQLRLTNRATGAVIDIVLSIHSVETPAGEWVRDGWEARTRCP